MGGLVVDIYVEYLFRLLAGMFKRLGSGGWSLVKATVTHSSCPKASYGCDVAEICYTYRVAGELYTGIHQKGFIFHSTGEYYAAQFVRGKEILVRVKPGD